MTKSKKSSKSKNFKVIKGGANESDKNKQASKESDPYAVNKYICKIFERLAKERENFTLSKFGDMIGLHISVASRLIACKKPLSRDQFQKIMSSKIFSDKEKQVISNFFLKLSSASYSESQEKTEKTADEKYKDYNRVTRLDTEKTHLFFISAIELGASLHTNAIKAINTFCNVTGAKPIFLPLRPHRKDGSSSDANYEALEEHIHTEYKINANLRIIEAELNAQQVQPLTGFSRYPYSIIIAHTKQNLKTYANDVKGNSRMAVSTGVITKPRYKKNRIGRLAKNDHVLGGLVVEYNGETGKFFVRPVKMHREEGYFISLGIKYMANGRIERAKLKGLVGGDVHLGQEDDNALSAFYRFANRNQAEACIFNDLIDGQVINPHTEKRRKQWLQTPNSRRSIPQELDYCKEKMDFIRENLPSKAVHYILDSNHDHFYHRYLDECKFTKETDKFNYLKGLELAYLYHVKNIDPIEHALLAGRNDTNMVFLHAGQELKIEGVQLVHGHAGANGAKGGVRHFSSTLIKSINGHDHALGIEYGSMSCGCLCKLKQGYNLGMSTWMHGMAAIYEGGYCELITIIDGDYTFHEEALELQVMPLDKKSKSKKAA